MVAVGSRVLLVNIREEGTVSKLFDRENHLFEKWAIVKVANPKDGGTDFDCETPLDWTEEIQLIELPLAA